MKEREIIKLISGIFAIMGGIIFLLSVMASYPKIQYSIYLKYNEYNPSNIVYLPNPQNFNLSIVKNTTYYSKWSKICFRIENNAEPIFPERGFLPASNLKANMNTNILCEKCIQTSFGALYPQKSVDICRNVKVWKNLAFFNIDLYVYYNALLLPHSITASYKCRKINETQEFINFACFKMISK